MPGIVARIDREVVCRDGCRGARTIVGNTGEIVSAAQPAALSSAWRTVLDLTPEQRAVRGRQARARSWRAQVRFWFPWQRAQT